MYWPLACDNSCLLASPPFVYVAKRENASPFISSAAYCAWLLANSPNREHARRQIGHCLVVFGFLHPKISQYKLPWHVKHPPLSFIFFVLFSVLFLLLILAYRITFSHAPEEHQLWCYFPASDMPPCYFLQHLVEKQKYCLGLKVLL